jgi:chitodextrinase
VQKVRSPSRFVWPVLALLLTGILSPASADTVITNLTVNNATAQGGTGLTYVVQQAGFVNGAVQYVQGNYTVTTPIPPPVNGQTYILTASGDAEVSEGSSNFMSFELGQSSTVYVALDVRTQVRPAWLAANFMDTATHMSSGGHNFELFSNVYPSGATVTLGANISSTSDQADQVARMYSVIVVPTVLDTQPPKAPSALHSLCSTAMVVGLQWTASKDNLRVAGYRISRNGTVVGTVSRAQTSYSDIAVAPSSNYTYVVTAFDAAGNTADSSPLPVATAAASATGDAPYCPSTAITAATFDFANAYSEAHTGNAFDFPPYSGGSDLWPLTWGSDGNVYTSFGDGWGLCGEMDVDQNGNVVVADKTSFGFAEITGNFPLGSQCPSQFLNGNIYGGYNSPHPYGGGSNGLLNGKATAVIAVGANFYATAGIWRSSDCTGTCRSSGAPKHVEIVSSMGNGYSWQDNTAWDFCNLSSQNVLGGAFNVCPVGFAHFGPGYTGAPDAFVYLYALDAAYFLGVSSTARANTYLLRVPNNQLLTQSAYQYFAGLNSNGKPIWTPNRNRRQPIFVDNNPNQSGTVSGVVYSFPMSMGIGEALYDAPLGRYLATAQGGKISQAAVFEAPNPWGPWSVIYYSNISPANGGSGGWGNLGSGTWNGSSFDDADTLGIRVTNAWTSADGLSTWMVFSSNGVAPANSFFAALAGNWMDSFNAVELTLVTP